MACSKSVAVNVTSESLGKHWSKISSNKFSRPAHKYTAAYLQNNGVNYKSLTEATCNNYYSCMNLPNLTSVIHWWNLPTWNCKPALEDLLCLNVQSPDIANIAAALRQAFMQESANGGHNTIRNDTVMSCLVHMPKVDDNLCASLPIRTIARWSKYDSRGIVSTLTLVMWSRHLPVCNTRKIQWFVHGKCWSSTNL